MKNSEKEEMENLIFVLEKNNLENEKWRFPKYLIEFSRILSFLLNKYFKRQIFNEIFIFVGSFGATKDTRNP